MDFLSCLKKDLNDVRKRRGYQPEEVLVRAGCLRQMIEAFERLDSDARSAHNFHIAPLDQRLFEAVTAMYHQQRKDSDDTIAIIMQTLLPLIEEKQKANHNRAIIHG